MVGIYAPQKGKLGQKQYFGNNPTNFYRCTILFIFEYVKKNFYPSAFVTNSCNWHESNGSN